MFGSRTVGTLATAVLLVGACTDAEERVALRAEGDADEELQAPLTPSPDLPWPPMAEQFEFGSCHEVENTVGEALLYLESAPEGYSGPECFIQGPVVDDDHWTAGVIYRPPSVDLTLGFEDAIERGAYAIVATIQPPRVWQPPPDNQRARPKDPSGGNRPVAVRGTRGLLIRTAPDEFYLRWSEPLGRRGVVNFYLATGGGEDPLRDQAGRLRSGRPPQ